MKFNFRLYLKTLYYSFFKSQGTPGRLSPKRVLVLLFIFLVYPFWQLSIRVAYLLDNLFYPDYHQIEVKQPIFIVGNFRSGTTLLHRLLTKDGDATSFSSWEIYLAPSIVARKLFRWLMKLNYAIGNPVQGIINIFNRIAAKNTYLHKIGINEVEEDGQVFFHLWSSYNLLAFFPFPKLVKQYIYYDDQIPPEEKEREMSYYQEVVKKHIYAHNGKRFISKNPSYSPKVKTLHQQFPDAKFINLVRNPLQVIPSSISLFSSHCHNYGDPEDEFSLQETVIEHSKHWYKYPHQYLKNLPPDQYICLQYRDLITDPQATIKKIYGQFGLNISPAYARILKKESDKAKRYKSKHKYSLRAMGLSKQQNTREFNKIIPRFDFDRIE